MSRIRSLFLWLVVLVLPLQGLAATSMLFCGQGADHAATVPVAQESLGHVQHGAAVHDAHAAHDDHAGHGDAPASADAGEGRLDDLAHQCSLCASCCLQLVVVSPSPPPLLPPAPQADPAEPLVLIRALAARLPEKPPRA